MSADFNQIVNMAVALLLAVILHEIAHGWAAYKLGDDTAKQAGRLTLNPIRHLDPVGSFLLPLALKLSGSPFILGYAKPVPVNFARLQARRGAVLMVASAGVTANLALTSAAGVLFHLILRSQRLWLDTLAAPFVLDLFQVASYSIVINLVLAVFNLLPIPPLDGSRILAQFLPSRLRIYYASVQRFGLLIVLLLLLTGALGRIISFIVFPLVDLIAGR